MASEPAPKLAQLEPSELGTKEYWDAVYDRELSNHAANPDDRGTVWFDDSDAEAKLLEFLDDREQQQGEQQQGGGGGGGEVEVRPGLGLSRETTGFIDLGCGNGSLLLGLRGEGWRGPMRGVDYSQASVDLARQIQQRQLRERALQLEQQEEGEEEEGEEGENGTPSLPIDFAEWDVLNGPLDIALDGSSSAARRQQPETGGAGAGADASGRGRGWDVVLDKGTFDALSLSSESDATGRPVAAGYRSRVLRLLRPGGVFLVTSCNWTEAELQAWFEGSGAGNSNSDGNTNGNSGRLELVDRVEYPSFSFGGVKGQTISTLCFQKKGMYDG